MELILSRVGAERRCGDLVLVATGEPLCVPITQVCMHLGGTQSVPYMEGVLYSEVKPFIEDFIVCIHV